MTREEREDAINFFREVAKKEIGRYSVLAIEALEEQLPYEDAISREYIKEKLQKHKDFHARFFENLAKDDVDKKLFDATMRMIEDVEYDVDNAPSFSSM